MRISSILLLVALGIMVIFLFGWAYAILIHGEPFFQESSERAGDGNFSDLPQFLTSLVIGVALGLIFVATTYFLFPKQSARWANSFNAYSRSIPWWHDAVYSLNFVMLTILGVVGNRWSFALFSFAFALVNIGAMVWRFFKREPNPA